ncbi:hypothetical protein BSL78_09795 [Apostichopus japonicus]|uniref:Uncharacterized protein n=1 Tax=Stichopus japonicus TaxID=307972 RepID=A0A2G8KZ71_STIJA|nr:hypothetical protein BSL78_09795 [Apostichopus japonicus]
MDSNGKNPFTEATAMSDHDGDPWTDEQSPFLTEPVQGDPEGLPSGYVVLSSTGSETPGRMSPKADDGLLPYRTDPQQFIPAGAEHVDVTGPTERLAGRSTFNPFRVSPQGPRYGVGNQGPQNRLQSWEELHRQNRTTARDNSWRDERQWRPQSNPFSYKPQERLHGDNSLHRQDHYRVNPAEHPRRANVMPPQFDGASNWDDYMVQFELISELNSWTEQTKALYLAASLKGQARAVLSDLDSDRRRNYQALTEPGQAIQPRQPDTTFPSHAKEQKQRAERKFNRISPRN